MEQETAPFINLINFELLQQAEPLESVFLESLETGLVRQTGESQRQALVQQTKPLVEYIFSGLCLLSISIGIAEIHFVHFVFQNADIVLSLTVSFSFH